MRMAVLAWTLALALVACVGCDLAGPETVPKDPGTVVAHVVDASGAGVRNVWVYVHDIPNHVGSTYSVGVPTDSSGRARIEWIPAGERRVDVKPPSGYASPDVIVVTVVKGKSVDVRFVLKTVQTAINGSSGHHG